jgi:hypothetical protein
MPNKFDQAPHGTICRAELGSDGQVEIYKQVCQDEENPLWELQDPKGYESVVTAGE